MDDAFKVSAPVYQQIAADIAAKIVEKRYVEGEKIYARSYIASQYGVSSETARRAICILSDLEIVEVTKGSGVLIKSHAKAVDFVRSFYDIQSINDLKKGILQSIERQKSEFETLTQSVTDLINRTDRFKALNPFVPFEIEITAACAHIDKSIADINFWHHTAATIISIKRDHTLLMSPGPYAVLREHDTLYFCGEENCLERVKLFLYPAKD